MPVWKLPDRTPLSESHWKPENAGKMNLRCDFELPKSDGSTVIAADGKLRIKAELQAGFDHRKNGSWIPYLGQGITKIRVALIRGTQVWKQEIGWMSLDVTTVNSFASITISELSDTQDSDGNLTFILDQKISAQEIGAGPLRVQVYMEGHPRHAPPHRRHGYNSRLAGIFSESLTIDGIAPETEIQSVTAVSNRPLVIGRATDNIDVKRVLLTLHDRYTGLYWSDNESEWTPRAEQISVDVHAQGGWWWSFPESANPGSGVYEVTATAEDIAERPRTRTNKQGLGQLDETPAIKTITRTRANPIVNITSPAPGSILSTGDKIKGTAVDDGAIGTLKLAIRDRISNQWWNPITRSWDVALSDMSEPQLILFGETHLSSRDEWSYEWRANFIEPENGSGHYELNAKATDLAGNSGLAVLNIFGSIDRVSPTVSILHPFSGEVIEAYVDVGSLLTIAGVVEDDRETHISSVQLALEDTETGLWWDLQNPGWQANRIDRATTWLDQRTGNTTNFTESRFRPFTTTNPGSGNFRLYATAIDGAGNSSNEVIHDFSIVMNPN